MLSQCTEMHTGQLFKTQDHKMNSLFTVGST